MNLKGRYKPSVLWSKAKAFATLACLVFGLSGFAQSQAIDLTLREVSTYDLSSGFSTNCFEKSFQDPTGLLWLKSCPFVGWEYNHHFTTFDGHTPRIPDFEGDEFPNGLIVQALDMTPEGIIYGTYSDEVRKKNGLFFLNTIDRTLRIRESKVLGSESLPLVSCQLDGESLILLFADTTGFDIRRMNMADEVTELVLRKRYDFNPRLRPENRHNPFIGRFVDASYIYHYQDNYWVLTGGLPFFRYDALKDSLTTIGAEHLGNAYEEYLSNLDQPPIFIPQTDGRFILALPNTEAGVFQYDVEKDTYTPFPALFGMTQNDRAGITKSASAQPNKAIRYLKNDPIEYENVLLNSDGSVTKVLLPSAVREVFYYQKSSSGHILVCTDAGLMVTQSKDNTPAQAFLNEFPMRSLLPLNDSVVLINARAIGKPISTFNVLNPNAELKPFSDYFQGNDGGQLVQRTDGKIWVPSGIEVALIDVTANRVSTFPNRFANFERFDLIDDTTLAVFYEGELFEWNPVTDAYKLLFSHPELIEQSGYLHALHIHSDGDFYIAMNNGLIRISKDFNKHEIFGISSKDQLLKILSITEDSEGRLWLGTYAHGIQVFNPEDESFQPIDISNGLLSNTVASIEAGIDGIMWAGTFNGVSIIDANTFEVVTTLTEDDGLANNESNRFSSGKFSDGRILIGSITGFSVISPHTVAKAMEHHTLPEIFLSAASWKDADTGEERIAYTSSDEIIELPANKRDLTLELALNVYGEPNTHKFKYKIGEGAWQFAGSSQRLYLNSLPTGSYSIQVKGIDHLGNESVNTAVIPINVLPFFYQQWWFYLLCALPFLVFGFAWVRRQKKIKKELITEVDLATSKLKEDKVLIESQARKLQELDELKSRFFTNISHEFRTPLSVILGIANRLEKHPDEGVNTNVGLIQKNTNILLNLINQILDLVKLEAGELQIDYVQANMIAFIHRIVDGIKPLADSKGVSVQLHCTPEELVMDLDQNKTFRILANLLSNAIKFTPENGEVKINTLVENGKLKLTVSDTGRGIPADNLPLIFDRFYQVDSSTIREGEGTGIGLNFTKELIELLSGTIEVQSTVGRGTTFTVWLPIKHNAALTKIQDLESTESIMMLPASEEMTATELPPDDFPLLLIIEDNADVAKVLRLILQPTYRLSIAENGQIGIDQAKALVPDMVLSDVMMPVKDGVQVLNELKNDPITSHIPVILLTAKADMKSRLEGLRRGADDYLSKPFHEEELKLRIKNNLEAKQRLQARYQNGAPTNPSNHPEVELEDAFILSLQKILEAHLDNSEFGIKDFCAELGVSRMQLHNKLKALTGLSTSNYIRSLRLKKAKELMKNAELTVSEIGYMVGFASHAYFSRSFSEQFGQSPSEYREKLS
ncbi:ATP-binding protein [Cryomorphaceae bacterium 1068]|nr:ATP-binding protein [Cryomorphaceae bacterium 1068]